MPRRLDRDTTNDRRRVTIVAMGPKLSWEGEVLAVHARIRLTRSFDQRSHSYLGYPLRRDVSTILRHHVFEFSERRALSPAPRPAC